MRSLILVLVFSLTALPSDADAFLGLGKKKPARTRKAKKRAPAKKKVTAKKSAKKPKKRLSWAEKKQKAKLAKKRAKQVKKNKRDGCKRERKTHRRLRLRYLFSSVQDERAFLNKKGKQIKDPKTDGKGRRFDHAVIKGRRVVLLEETTGPKVDKSMQMKKTKNILSNNGKVYIKDKRTGELLRVRPRRLLDPVSWFAPTKIKVTRRRASFFGRR